LRTAQLQGSEVIVPAVVVAQTIRGGRRDAAIYRLLHAVRVSFVGVRLARVAGELLVMSGLSDAVDALVMAEALRNPPAVLLTGDPDDMTRLAASRPGVRIVPV